MAAVQKFVVRAAAAKNELFRGLRLNLNGLSTSLRTDSVRTVASRNIDPDLKFRPATPGVLKEIVRRKSADGTFTIEGKHCSGDAVPKAPVLDIQKEACPLCSLNMEIHYTDVLIIKQFVRKDGCILPRRITGLCAKQQVEMAKLIHKAQNAGLLTSLRPPLPNGRERKPDKESFYKFKGFNRYFTKDYR